ncbi:hypothetical protein SPRG_21975 [Saprolegnia parasitica CBS 223.65]|uniref:Uncharacterized protein n=1 Tax=Saprolegnia parasitica (strain CBS 223.65) TaxID=695850 RepID=A0A067BE75_SAPPC|nr:hypothetical protein SPRG_21975 [Saprolegnia parasitica CBS 223.65]KDO16654.1 hypothetical protein SPRG_21975 [Saprolegnia parasitica CBS 223.65]|eukprot:XP_012212636.1 hypothetical protein SPRG_21975 [Saprolegnia parasitica CBS 223.65]
MRARVLKVAPGRRARLERLAVAGRAAALVKYSLSLRPGEVNMFQRGQPSTTAAAYEKVWNGLAEYCLLRGDYESLLFLDDRVPVSMPSMGARTIAEYIDYKTQPRSTALDDEYGRAILGADLEPVCCPLS